MLKNEHVFFFVALRNGAMIFDCAQIGLLVTLTATFSLIQGQTCRCGYGGFCLKVNGAWLNAPCLCDVLNSGENPVYRGGETCNELIDYCPQKTNCPSCQRAWGYANCVCQETPNRIILPDCSVNLGDFFPRLSLFLSVAVTMRDGTAIPLPSPLQPRILIPTTGWDWNKAIYVLLTVDSGSLKGIFLKWTLSDGRTLWYTALESWMKLNFRFTCQSLARRRPMSVSKQICGEIQPNVRWLDVPLSFGINLRSEGDIIDNVHIENYPYNIAGRMESFTVEMIAPGENVIFTHKSQVFIEYPPDVVKCAREIRINGCSPKHLEPAVYELHDEIHLRPTFTEYHKCETLKINYVIWSLNYAAYRFKSAGSEGFSKIVAPFELKVGKQIISLNVKLHGSTTSHSFDSTYTQYHHCFLEVKRGKFSFAIAGGNRSVLCNTSVDMRVEITNDNFRLSDVKIYWSCNTTDESCKERVRGTTISVHPPCRSVVSYRVRITTEGDSGQQEEFIDTVVIESMNQEVRISCIRGCEYGQINPNLEVVFGVIENPVLPGHFDWLVTPVTDVPLTPDVLRRKRRNNLVKVKPFHVKPGVTYTISAIKPNGGRASIELIAASNPARPKCSVSPSRGVVGDRFKIICSAEEGDGSPLHYEVLDHGRYGRKVLIHSATSNIMKNIVLHSETLTVRVINHFSMFSETTVNVQLKPAHVSDPEIEEIFSRMSRQMSARDEDGCLEDMIDLTEKLDTSRSKFPPEFKKMTSQILAEMKIYDEPRKVEQVLNIVDAIVSKPDFEERDADRVTLTASNVILKVADSMKQVYQRSKYVHHVSQIAGRIEEFINTTSTVIYYNDPVLQKLSETAEIKQIHIRRKEKIGENVAESIKKVADLMFNMSTIEEDEYLVRGDKITLWTAIEDVDYINNVTERQIGKMPVFQFSNEALERHKGATVGVFMGVFEKEWMSWTKTVPTSQIANVLLYRSNGSALIEMDRPRGPFHILLPMGAEVRCATLSGRAKRPSEQLSVYGQDRMVTVMRFRLPAKSGVFLIKMDETLRSQIRGSIDYALNISILRCLIYSQRKWRADKCKVRKMFSKEGELILDCMCEHASIFSAEYFLPPNELILTQDIFLFLNILSNLYVPILVGCILVAYLTLLLYGKIMDAFENDKRVVIRLDDNYPGEKEPYIVVAYTSGRCAAGTTSNVAIQVMGEKSRSRVHILESSTRSALHTNQDDWFLMFTKDPLGPVTRIKMWHDNSGRSPDWFCTRIVVYDVKNKIDYVFIVEEWFQITSNPEESQSKFMDVFVAKDGAMAWRKIAASNVESGVRENHHWASIFMRHPRSLYTRSERSTIAVGFLLTTMLISMLFFDVDDVGPADIPSFSFDLQDFIKAIESMLLSTVGTFCTLFFFERSKAKIKKDVIKSTYKTLEKESKTKGQLRTKVKAALFEPLIYRPAVMDEREGQERWDIWLFLAWVLASCTIVVTSFFIVLFGLKFGQKKSLIWTATFILGIVNDAIIFNPIMIIISALLIAYLFRTPRLEKFELEVTYKEEKMTLDERLDQLREIIKARTRPEYKPIPLAQLKILSRKQVVNRLRHELAFSSAIILCLCISVAVLMHLFGTYTIYLKNLEFRSFFYDNDWLGGTSIYEIYNKGKYYDYLTETALPAIHKIKWYNGRPLVTEGNEDSQAFVLFRQETDVKGYVIDYTTKLIGVPRLRQQRLANTSTVTISRTFTRWFSNLSYGRLTYFGQDRETFIPGWIPYDPEERVLDDDELWMYTSIYDSETGMHSGKSGIFYLGDGYSQILSWSLGNSSIKVIDLYATDWIDNRTRSVFFEINVFNVNVNLFTTICVLSEFLPSGVYAVKPIIETASLQFTTSSSEFGILILVVVTTFIIGVNTANALYFMSRRGFRKYIATWRGFNNLVLVGTGICFVTVFFNRFLYFKIFIDKLYESPRDQYTTLYPAFNYNFFAHCFTGFFIICTTSIGITIIHGLIGYEKFKKALDAAKIILLVGLCINLAFSIFTAFLCFYYGSPIVEMFYMLVIFREVDPSTMDKMKDEWIYQVVMYVGLGVIIFFLFNKASQIYYYERACKLYKKQVLAINVAIYGLQEDKSARRDEAQWAKHVKDHWARWRERMKKRKRLRGSGSIKFDARDSFRFTSTNDSAQAFRRRLSMKWKQNVFS